MTSHMAREVAEIPQAARRFLDDSRPALQAAAAAMRTVDPALIVTVARGSSDHAATYLKYAVELLAGVPVASVGPSVASVYRRPLRLSGAACVGISQSGRSPDIVEMMRAAGEGGALSIAITNFADSPMAEVCAHCLPLLAGVGVVPAGPLAGEAQGLVGAEPLDVHAALGRGGDEALCALARAIPVFIKGETA